MEQKLSETDKKLFYVKLPLLLLLSSFSPFLLAPLYLCITGITTIDEFITILLSPYTILAYVIAVLCPLVFYGFLKKRIKSYDGTDEVIRKINLLLKYSRKIIFAINLVLVIGISFLACFVIHLKGLQFEAFEETSLSFNHSYLHRLHDALRNQLLHSFQQPIRALPALASI